MKLFEEGIVLINFFTLVLLELNIECLSLLIYPSIEVLVVVGKLLLFIPFEPKQQLVFNLTVLFVSSLHIQRRSFGSS